MTTFAEYRERFPQYADMSDEEFARGLHRRYYSDMPFDEFSRRIGYEAAPAPDNDVSVEDEATRAYLESRGETAEDALERSQPANSRAQPQRQPAARAQPEIGRSAGFGVSPGLYGPAGPRITDPGRMLMGALERVPVLGDWLRDRPEEDADEIMYRPVPERADVRWEGGPLSGALNALPRNVRTWLDAEGRSTQIGLGFFLDASPESRANILRTASPEGEFRESAEGSLMFRHNPNDEWAYLNRPGPSVEDAQTLASEGIKYVPAMRTAALGVTLPGRALTGALASGATNVASDAAAMPFGGTGPRADEAALMSAFGGGAQLLGDLFVAGWQAAPQVARHVPGLREIFNRPPAVAAAGTEVGALEQAAARLSASETAGAQGAVARAETQDAAYALADEFDIPLTRGQASGDPAQIAREQRYARGGSSEAARNIMGPFIESQAGALERSGIRLATRGHDPISQNVEDAGNIARGAMLDRRNALDNMADDMFARAERQGASEPILSPHNDLPTQARWEGSVVFETADGSLYSIGQGGRTTQYVTLSNPAEGITAGAQAPSTRTVYVTPQQLAQLRGSWQRGDTIHITADDAIFVAKGGGTARGVARAGPLGPGQGLNTISHPAFVEPRPGLHPVQVWGQADDGSFREVRWGDVIKRIGREGDAPISTPARPTVTGQNGGGALDAQPPTQPPTMPGAPVYGDAPAPPAVDLPPAPMWGLDEAASAVPPRRVAMPPPAPPAAPNIPGIGGARPPESPSAAVARALDDEIINLPEPHLADARQAVQSVQRLSLLIEKGEATFADVMRTRQAINALWRRAQSSDRYAVGVVRRSLDDWTERTFGRSPGAESMRSANAIYRERREMFGQRSSHDLGGGVLDDILEGDRTGTAVVDAILGASKPPKSALQAVRRIREMATQTTQAGRRARRPTMTEGNARFRSNDQLPTDELQAVREALMYRVMAPIYARQPGGALPAEGIVSNLRRALDGPGSSITRELFTEPEIAMMRSYLKTVERLVPPVGTVNHSGTAYELSRMLANMSDSLFSFLHIPNILVKAPLQAATLNARGVVDAVRAQRATERPMVHFAMSERPGYGSAAIGARGALEDERAR